MKQGWRTSENVLVIRISPFATPQLVGEFVPDPCPSGRELRSYAEGRLDESAAASVADHIEQCEACRRSVEDAEHETDWLIGRLRGELPGDPLLLEEECLASIRQAHQVAWEGSQPPPAQQADWFDEGGPGHFREYRLLRRLGQGAMGAVYEAVHTRLGRNVAVKLLPERRTRQPEAVARFRREMEAVGRLDHPNIIRATDAGECDGRHFLVMELVDGCDLARLSERLGPLPINDACELVRQAAAGLAHVHEHELVHRDVKPSNLLLTRDGVVKVTDLGLALLEPRWSTVVGELTESGQLMGTLDYMAPEQAETTRVDIRADVFGLGATLFKLLTGRAPLEAPHLDTLLKKVAALADYQPPSAAKLRSDLPPDLLRLMNAMLAKDPGDRPVAPGEIAAALQPFSIGAQLGTLSAQAMDRGDRSSESVDATRPQPRSVPSASTPVPHSTTTRAVTLQRPPPRRPAVRRWTLLAASLAIVGVVAVWVGIASNREDDGEIDREVAELVLELGGVVDIAHDGDVLETYDESELPSTSFRVDWIKLTANPNVRDEHLEQFAQLRHLEGITLQETEITDAGVRLLGQIPTLSHAYLNVVGLTDDGVQPLTKLQLLELTLNDTQVTNVTLERLVGQADLERLHVRGTRITNDGLRSIARISSLRALDLRETALTDAGLAHLSVLTDLEELSVSDTEVSDGGLPHLFGLARLKLFEAARTGVTLDGASQLQDALPACHVVLED